MKKSKWPLVAFIAGFSGFYSLLYQALWDRVLRFNFGGDSVSSAIVTSSFLLGLGIGALVFGRSRARPARTLGFVEIGIGLFALASFHYLGYLGTNLGAVLGADIEDISRLRTAVIVGSVLFIVPPSILMGGTLPLFFNCFIGEGRFKAKSVGLIYRLNTLGAAAGVLGAPFLFLNHFDIPTTLILVGGAQILFGLWLVTRGSRWHLKVDDDDGTEATPSVRIPAQEHVEVGLGWILLLSAVSGAMFSASLFRHFYTFNPSSPYNFPLVLMPYLLGLAAGSWMLTCLSSQSAKVVLTRIGSLFLLSRVALVAAVWLGADTPSSRRVAT